MRGDIHAQASVRRTLGRGELVRLAYRLGRHGASGVLTLTSGPSGSRGEVFVLRRGSVLVPDGELAKRAVSARLARLTAVENLHAMFEGGAGVSPPGAQPMLSLASWSRQHLESQLDNTLAEILVRQLAGIRLSLRYEMSPEPADEADRRMLAAMAQPRRLDQIWPLSRTPRFRLLAFLHFLRSVDALEVEGVVAERSSPMRGVDPYRLAAARLLGVADIHDATAVKRAYRRLARALHPDMEPNADEPRKRALERRFAEVTAAYEALRV
jgi:DnaJ-domain-containing protein 1